MNWIHQYLSLGGVRRKKNTSFSAMKSCVHLRQQPLLENDDGDSAWHFVSVHCDGDTVVGHQNPGKIGLAITTHLDRAAELGWSESMNKSASPRRIINTCLSAHRYNCMLMPCTSATCCRLLNAEYNAIQVHCEDARTRSKVRWKESWLPSVTFTWNIDEVNLWIKISAFRPLKKNNVDSFSVLFVGKDAAYPVETQKLGLCCGCDVDGAGSLRWRRSPLSGLWTVWGWVVEVHSGKTELQTVGYLISLWSPTEDGEICKSKMCYSLLTSTIICASHTAKNKNILTKSKWKHESSLKALYYSNFTSTICFLTVQACVFCVSVKSQLITESKIYFYCSIIQRVFA